MRVPLLIDGNSLYARSFYASSNHEVGSPVSFFLQTILSLLNPRTRRLPLAPTVMLCCWDGGSKRDKQRGEKPQEYFAGLQLAREAVKIAFQCVNAFPEKEADDACATAAQREAERTDTQEVYVVSGDKDLQQLASDKIRYFCLNEKSLLSYSYICRKWTIKRPEQVAIALAILGDKSDLIQGVHKYGPKKVAKLFEAVTEQMDLATAAEVIAKQIPVDKFKDFEESLELTLLDRYLPNIPEPGELNYSEASKLVDLGFGELLPQIEALDLGLAEL